MIAHSRSYRFNPEKQYQNKIYNSWFFLKIFLPVFWFSNTCRCDPCNINPAPSFPHFIIHALFTQTLTTLALVWNEIGPQGAQYLASVLQINKVTSILLLPLLLLLTSPFTHFSHRHSTHYASHPMKSDHKEHEILPML
jgi:hypothetical protein